jgi:predicted DNA binding CopG/RHH family protein
MKAKLSKEEKEILESFEKGEWVPVEDFSQRKKELIAYARNTMKKDKRLNIRISERDLLELQRKAMKEGLPYQTYVSSIIHKFVNGPWLVNEGRPNRVAARSTLCCFLVRELGLTATAVAETLGMGQPAVSIAVRRGEAIVKERGLRLPQR